MCTILPTPESRTGQRVCRRWESAKQCNRSISAIRKAVRIWSLTDVRLDTYNINDVNAWLWFEDGMHRECTTVERAGSNCRCTGGLRARIIGPSI